MKIGDENYKKAVEIISASASKCKVAFNVPIKDNYSNVYPILLIEATPALIENLIYAGYSIGVVEKGTYVDKI